MLEQEIKELFEEYEEVLYGFASAEYSPFGKDYASVLVFAVPYATQDAPDTYTEEKFEDGRTY